MKRYTGTVIEKEMLKPMLGVMRFDIDGDMDFVPGQFANITIEHDGENLMRPFSMANPPGTEHLEFYIKAYPDGEVSEYILELEEGDEAVITGPYGGFQLQDSKRDVYFVCAGSGVAPVMGMARHMLGEGRERLFLHGASHIDELGYRGELKEMQERDDNFTYVPTVSRPEDNPEWSGREGRVESLLHKCSDTGREVYICGPPPMVDNVRGDLKEKGFSDEQIFTEQYY